MRRKSLDTVKIAARAKAKWSDLDAEAFQRPAHIDKLVSIIAVVNLKGGVGKSTIAVNLACELAIQQSVVVVDADSQATATDWARRGDLPARVETLPLDADSQVCSWVEKVLTIQADHVVIDCPPHIGPATLAAVGIADMVLIPVTPSGADLVATDSALAVVHDAQATRKDNGPSMSVGTQQGRFAHRLRPGACSGAGEIRRNRGPRNRPTGGLGGRFFRRRLDRRVCAPQQGPRTVPRFGDLGQAALADGIETIAKRRRRSAPDEYRIGPRSQGGMSSRGVRFGLPSGHPNDNALGGKSAIVSN